LYLQFGGSVLGGIRALVHSKLLGAILGAVQAFYRTREGQLEFLVISSTKVRDDFS